MFMFTWENCVPWMLVPSFWHLSLSLLWSPSWNQTPGIKHATTSITLFGKYEVENRSRPKSVKQPIDNMDEFTPWKRLSIEGVLMSINSLMSPYSYELIITSNHQSTLLTLLSIVRKNKHQFTNRSRTY